jgi:hypothetical protein
MGKDSEALRCRHIQEYSIVHSLQTSRVCCGNEMNPSATDPCSGLHVASLSTLVYPKGLSARFLTKH